MILTYDIEASIQVTVLTLIEHRYSHHQYPLYHLLQPRQSATSFTGIHVCVLVCALSLPSHSRMMKSIRL